MEALKKLIREIPDFPKRGILFYDITTLLRDADGFRQAVESMVEPFQGGEIDVVAGKIYIVITGLHFLHCSKFQLESSSCKSRCSKCILSIYNYTLWRLPSPTLDKKCLQT